MAANTHSLDLERSSTQYATTPDHNNFDFGTGDFTIECWIKRESINISAGLVVKTDNSDINGWALRIESSNKISINAANGSANSQLLSTTAITSTSAWYHIAATRSNSGVDLKMYLDSVLDNSATVTARSVTGTPSVSVGQYRASDTTNLYDGLIDEIRIWNVARTQQQIEDNMEADVTGQAGLIAYWKLNNAYTDSTGNGHTLTASGSPSFSTDVPFANYINNNTGNFFMFL